MAAFQPPRSIASRSLQVLKRCLPIGTVAPTIRRARIRERATERILEDLEDSSPETLRARLKALDRQVTVQVDGTVVVEGTYEPLVTEERAGAKKSEGGAAEAVRRMLVPGEVGPELCKTRHRS